MFRAAFVRAASAAARQRGGGGQQLLSSSLRPCTTTEATRSATMMAAAIPNVFLLRAFVGGHRLYSSEGGLPREQVEGRIMSLLQGFDKVNDVNNITPTAHFANDMGLDSLDAVEVVMAIEEEFSIEIPDKDADSIHSVDKAVDYILAQPDAS
ncbi:hypothetical protein L249_0636 [Ophiocordyceps polyrhachis-furcata BCC 54312]|uniref:Acyl carrier protein n=1 Tax=Ophiocordyceps polyrhachis-furcata BCC 54312 TaxID=1330021 RepID=A0A367LGD8_9HYPO|nr:hypothetical protein L249_0636 [Ophiocordyceps polyrhachis-furcata BCC 54312]